MSSKLLILATKMNVRLNSLSFPQCSDQWISNGGVCKVFTKCTMGHIVTLYQPKHEADIWNFSLCLHWDSLTTNPELLPLLAPACLCNPQRTEKICFLLNTTLLSKCAVMEFSALLPCILCNRLRVDKNAGVVTNKPLAAVYSFIYQWPWQLWAVWSGPGTKTYNNSFLSSS